MFVQFKAEKMARFSIDGFTTRNLAPGESAEMPEEIASSLQKQGLGKMLKAPENKKELEPENKAGGKASPEPLAGAQDGTQAGSDASEEAAGAPKKHSKEDLAALGHDELVELALIVKPELPKHPKQTSKIDLIEAILKKQGE